MSVFLREKPARSSGRGGAWSAKRAVGQLQDTPPVIRELLETVPEPHVPVFQAVPLFGRRRRDHAALVLFMLALLMSATVGFLRGTQHGRGDALIGAALAAPIPVSSEPQQAFADEMIPEVARLQAEIIRLRILFARLARVAQLDEGEFDPERDALELPAVRSAMEGLDLSARALAPLASQASVLATIFDERQAAHARRIGGEVAPGTFRTSGFGLRRHPTLGVRQLHRGVDFAGLIGTPVLALADGIVSFSGPNGAYGNLVEIEHGDGYRTRYAHNQKNLVRVGAHVTKGDQIALLGSTGRSTGAHVHVEVREHGRALDPTNFVF